MWRVAILVWLCMYFATPSLAQTPLHRLAAAGSTLALIGTRDALQHFLQDTSDFNPLARLSPHARARLVETLLVDAQGRITSLYVEDIRRELTPVEAYKVLALFGAQDLADRVNNGRTPSATDSAVMIGVRPSAWLERHYCNGGYCTYNPNLACNSSSCQPPQ